MLETGNWKLETGNWKLETGNWKLETGDWRLETGDWLLVSQRFDRIQARGFERGEQAEEDADARREADAEREGPPRQRDGEAGQLVHAHADAAAEDDADHAAHRRQECRFDQELPEHFPPPRAERFSDADLARALGDRDHHDRHDADAADHQRDRGDHDQPEERRLADLVPHLQDGVLRGEVEVVRLVELEIVADAQNALDLARRLVAHAFARDHGDHRGAEDRRVEAGGADLRRSLEHLAELLLVRAVGNQHEVVGAAEAARGGPLAEHADHGVEHRADADLLVDRIDVGEERLPRAVAEDHHRRAVIDFRGGEDTAGFDLREVDGGPVRGRAEDADLPRFFVLVIDARAAVAALRSQPHVDQRHRGAVALDRPRVLDGQDGPVRHLEIALAGR